MVAVDIVRQRLTAGKPENGEWKKSAHHGGTERTEYFINGVLRASVVKAFRFIPSLPLDQLKRNVLLHSQEQVNP
jgi:hypothetical protein